MKLKITQKNIRTLIRFGLFICAITIVFQLIPRREQFEKNFQQGKPWQYELLTASFDFPIYKSTEELDKERDSIMHFFIPYFSFDPAISQSYIVKLENSVKNNPVFKLNHYLSNAVISKLKEVYDVGIMANSIKDELTEQGVIKIAIIDSNRIAREYNISDVYTPTSAYDFICTSCGSDNEKTIKSLDINHFLGENIIYDKNKSEQAKTELLKRIVPTSGMIQAGERIIDRGEIIDTNTFKVLNSLKIISENSNLGGKKDYLVMMGELLLIMSLLLLMFLYLYLFRSKILESNRSVLFVLMMQVGIIALASFTIRFTNLNIYLIPFAILPIIIRTFFDSRTALFAHIITVLLVAFMVPAPFEFLLLQITVGMTAVSSLKEMSQRSQLMQTSIYIFLSYSIIFLATSLMREGSFNQLNWINFIYFAVNSMLLLFAYGLIYIFEKVFGFLSNVTLVELSNINSPLMQTFSEKAPGTFQHVLQVSNLATEAAKTINANVLLARTGALYHDIGKISNPMFFAENQIPGINPLNDLDLEDAAQIIISHVNEGVRIAEKENLPKQIVNFIRMHHGKSKTGYFYNTFKNKFPNKEINEDRFTYPGPLPNSKESAIVMMADAVEASSRSLKNYEDNTIDELVEKIIDGQIADGAFKNAPITFRDVERVKTVFKAKLKTIYHSRMSYPELKASKKTTKR